MRPGQALLHLGFRAAGADGVAAGLADHAIAEAQLGEGTAPLAAPRRGVRLAPRTFAARRRHVALPLLRHHCLLVAYRSGPRRLTPPSGPESEVRLQNPRA